MSSSVPLSSPQDLLKKAAAERALEFIHDNSVVGLGTGSTMRFLLECLADRVKEGLGIRGVPTSKETATLATQLGIPIVHDEDNWSIDVAVDGADQVDPQFNLIKGGGGALLREKIVANAAQRFIVIVDAGKQVPILGSSFPLPVEVVPFGWPNTAKCLSQLGFQVTLRKKNGSVFVTDSQNYILDLAPKEIPNPGELEIRLNHIPGVVENGIFTGMTSTLIVGKDQETEVFHAENLSET